MSVPRTFVAFVVVASVAAATACTLLVDVDDLAADDSGTIADATDDRSLTDAGGGADGGDASDAKACDGTFCDDFDDSPLGAKWTTVTVEPGASLTYGTPARSSPNALQARVIGAAPTADDRVAWLERELGPGKKVHCDLSLYVSGLPEGNQAFTDLFVIRAKGAAALVADYYFWFAMTDDGAGQVREDLFFQDGGCACPRLFKNVGALPVARWIRVGVDFDFDSLKVTYDGVLVLTSGDFGGFVPSGPMSVGLGIYARRQLDTKSSVLFDDVVCAHTP